MQYLKEKNEIEFTVQDINKFKTVLLNFGNRIKLNKLGFYSEISKEDIWYSIVNQFLISYNGTYSDHSNFEKDKNQKFRKAISLQSILNQKNKEDYIAHVLLNYEATQYYKEQSKKIFTMLINKDIVDGNNIVLFDGMSYDQDFNDIRDELLKRNPLLKMKNVSDLMIELGFSDNVITLDSIFIGFLTAHLNFNISLDKIQSNKKLYLLIEESIREVCRELNTSIATLDRIIFKYMNIPAIDFILETEI